VSNVLDMGCLFDFCASLEDISPLQNWDLSNVFNITALFRGCVNLKDISPLSKWDLSRMHRNKALLAVFSYCTNLRNISPLKKWDVSNITRMSGLFEGCTSLRDASPLKRWDVSNVTSLDFLFRECSSLSDISNFKSWNIESLESVTGMLDGCSDLIDVSPFKKWDVSNIKSMNKLFYNCISLADVSSLNDWKVSPDASIKAIFDKCDSLEEYPGWFKVAMMRNNEADTETRQKIINDLDEEFFKSHDLNEFDEDTQLFMVAATESQNLLAYISERSKNRFIQEKALDRITDEEILTRIVLNDHNCDLSRVNGKIKSYFYNRERALIKITNKAFLMRIAKELPQILDNFAHLAQYIDTDAEWVDIVLNAKSQHIRIFALANVRSANSFETIIQQSSDEQLVKVARLNMPKEKPVEDEQKDN